MDVQQRVTAYICKMIDELAWSDLADALNGEAHLIQKSERRAVLAALPALACVMVGGDVEQAVSVTAVWRLDRLAAELFDSVIDHDVADKSWSTWPLDRTINVGLGLLFVARQCLDRLPGGVTTQTDIRESIHSALVQAARGQAHPPAVPSLDEYFRYILLKTAWFFATYLRAGARTHTHRQRVLQAVFDYGLAFGMYLQLCDDVDNLSPKRGMSDLISGLYTLPVIFAQACSDHALYPQWLALWQTRITWSENDRDVVRQILVDMGVVAKCQATAEVYAYQARQALRIFPTDQAEPLLSLLPEEIKL